MKRKIVLLIVIVFCLGIVGCGSKKEPEAVETSNAAEEIVEEEIVEEEKDEPVSDQVEEVEDKNENIFPVNKVGFENKEFSIIYDENNFILDEKDEGVAIYSKLPDTGKHNTILVFMPYENDEFDSIGSDDVYEFKENICKEVCLGLFDISEDTKIIDENYDSTRGYFIELSDGTKCYTKIMSYGKTIYIAVCRLCPYSEPINDVLFSSYVLSKCLVKDYFEEQKEIEANESKVKGEEKTSKDESTTQVKEYTDNNEQISKESQKEEDSSIAITSGQSNALRKAHDYLDFSSFSYKGLIDQLKYEKFTDDEAKYAADNCGADWNEQAVKKAKDYLDMMGFSKEGLIDQLIYEGFTREQATYGAESNGL